MRLRRLAALAAATGLVLAACGGDDSGSNDTTTTAPSTETTVDGGDGTTTVPSTPAEDCTATVAGSELNYAGYAPTSSLDPLQSSGALAGGTDLLAIYDSLMRWDPDTNEWVPHVAESLTSNDDFTEWTLKLREGVTYSNGDPMVAQDVLYNLNRMLGQGRNASRGMIARIDLDNSVATDDLTVVFKLLKPWSNFGYLLADAPGMVVNPAVGDAVDSAEQSVIGNDPTGAGVGPYTVAKWAPGESPYLVLKARADYWGGAPCVETVNFLSIPQDGAKLESLQLGEVDIAFLRSPEYIADARDSGDYSEFFELQSVGASILINQGVGTFNPIGEDLRFRQAVYAALDRDAISQRAFDGKLLVQTGIVQEESRWYTEGQPTPEQGMDLATQLVDELKADGWDGKIRLVCPNTVPDEPIAYQGALEAAGMEVDVQVVDSATHIAAVAVNRDFDLACWGMNVSDSALIRQIGFNFQSDSPSNRIAYSNPEFDALIDQLYAAPDDDARRAAVAEMAALYAADVPMAVVGALEEGVMVREGVTGVLPTQQTMFLFQDVAVAG